MIKYIWIFIVSFFASILEIVFSGINLIFPGSLFLSFYLVVSYNKTIGIIAGALACVVTEIALGRTLTGLPLLIPVALFAEFWRCSGDRRYLPIQSISGALIGFFYFLFCLCGENFSLLLTQAFYGFSFFLSLLATVGISAVALPILLFFLDLSSHKLDMRKFGSQKRIMTH